MTDTDSERRLWAAVARAPHLHADHLRPALAQAGSLAALWRQPVAALRALGLPPSACDLLANPPEAVLDADLAWLAREGVQLLAYTDADYPAQLAQIPAAPAALYVRGDVAALGRPQRAMVGSRRPTGAGRHLAFQFAEGFAAAGLVVTSGLARGIDAASHEGALAAGGQTIAVCGTGLDRIYPAQHATLAQRIATQGALVSEFPPGTAPLPANFPRRNRLISGLSRGTLVVEAARDSGSLITARRALDQGREVFAIPGSVLSPTAQGCHDLIRDGARLVTHPGEVLSEVGIPIEKLTEKKQSLIQPQPSPDGARRLDKPAEMLLDALGFEPTSIDDLVERTGLEPGSIASLLLLLELELRIEPQPGGLYCRVRP